jgi:hypothetical protein
MPHLFYDRNHSNGNSSSAAVCVCSRLAMCWLQVEASKQQQQPAASCRLPGALPLLACGGASNAAAEVVVAATVSSIDGGDCYVYY